MQNTLPPTLLRRFRKRSALRQCDIAFLSGCSSAAQVSRYEHFKYLPNLETALAFHVIFGVPLPHLFPGIFQRIEKRVQRRARRLIVQFQKTGSNSRRQQALRSIITMPEYTL